MTKVDPFFNDRMRTRDLEVRQWLDGVASDSSRNSATGRSSKLMRWVRSFKKTKKQGKEFLEE